MLRSLQAGRALAAAAVAAFHLSLGMGLARYGGKEVFGEYTRLGNRGVDFFFVLSGFIILFAHHEDIDKPSAWGKYVYRRFVRLYPIYWLYTLVFVALLAILGGTDAKMPTTFGDWATSLSLVRFTGGEPPLQVAWTLFHEVAFYAVFSILIISRRAGFVALGAFMLVAILFYQYPAEGSRSPLNVYTAAYNLFFLLGMCSFWLYRRGGNGLIEFSIGLFITVAALRTIPLPHQLSPLLLVFGFSVFLAGIAKLEQSGQFKIPLFLAFIGDASYTIYLTHVSFEGLLLKIAMKISLPHRIGYESTFFLVFAGTISLGCVAYYLIERPLLDTLRQKRKRASVMQTLEC